MGLSVDPSPNALLGNPLECDYFAYGGEEAEDKVTAFKGVGLGVTDERLRKANISCNNADEIWLVVSAPLIQTKTAILRPPLSYSI